MLYNDPAHGLIEVIHGNGVDDDLAGFRAALENKPVLFGGRVYEPGETLDLGKSSLAFDCAGLLVLNLGETAPEGLRPEDAVIFNHEERHIVLPVDARFLPTSH